MANVIILKGKNFRPCFSYLVREDKQARILGGMASSPAVDEAIDKNLVFNSQNNQKVIDELSWVFDLQSSLNTRTSLVCRHTIIAFDPQDGSLSDSIKVQAAYGYMVRMGYVDSSWIAFDHQRDDHRHKHIHLISHAINVHGQRISDSFDFAHSRKAIIEVEEDLGLTPSISNIEKLVIKNDLLLNLNSKESLYNLVAADDEISIATLFDGEVGKRIDKPNAHDLAIKVDGYTVAETDSDGVITFYDDELIEIIKELQHFTHATSEELEPIPEYYTFPESVQSEEGLDLD
jgi:hypothetical protein